MSRQPAEGRPRRACSIGRGAGPRAPLQPLRFLPRGVEKGGSRASRRRGGATAQAGAVSAPPGVRPPQRSRVAGAAPRGVSGKTPPLGSTRHGAWRAARATPCRPVGGGRSWRRPRAGLFFAPLAVPLGGQRQRPPSRTAIVATDPVVTLPCRQPSISSPERPPRSPSRPPLVHTPPPLLASASWPLCCRPCRCCLRRPPPPPPVCAR